MLHKPYYNPKKSYEENYNKGPYGSFADRKKFRQTGTPEYDFFGYPVYLPFGIPAGPVLNSKFVKGAFNNGFDLVVYKTVRSKKYSSTKKTVHTGHKGYYRLYINKKNVVKSLLDLIHPHLTARVIQTDIVLEFLRKSTLVVQYRPTKEDVYLIQKLRNISQRVFKLDLWLSRVDIVASKKGNR